MSTCVLNTLRENVKGVMDPTTGDSTVSVELTSRVFLTGDLIKSTCLGGPNHAAPCSRQGVAKRGGTCEGGVLQNAACASDADCEGGICIGICGACTNDGSSCQDDSDCTGGATCEGLCADEADGECDDTGESCRLKGICVGSANPGLECQTSDDCSGFCVGGSVEGRLCVRDTQCRGGTCTNRDACMGSCIGSSIPGEFCIDDSDCSAGTCGFSDCPTGTCVQVGRPVQPCPTCVDENHRPVTDASTPGTCNLGASKGEACVSTNSLGLTTDCLPVGGPEEEVGEGNTGTYLADIDVTIPAITTGKAEMIADADGTFCNFGRCVGGADDGKECNNGWSCDSGVCQKYCQILGGADKGVDEGGTDPNNDPTCEVHDDCTEPGVTTWRPCGQSDPGAFTGDVDGQILGGATVRRFILEGEPAPAPVEIGEIKEAKLVAAFCIPRTGDQAIDNAGSLPGPGSTSLKGTFELLREE